MELVGLIEGGFMKTIMKFTDRDIQLLSKKYLGKSVTPKEMALIKATCSPDSWARVDDGGWEGCLSPFIQAIVDVIKLVRRDYENIRQY